MNKPTAFLLVLFLTVTLLSYLIAGPAWDIIAHYLNAKNYLNPLFLSRSFGSFNNRGWEIQYNTFYIEPSREVMPTALLVPLELVFNNPVLPYLVVLCIILAVSIWSFGKSLNLDNILTYSLMLSPFFIYFSLLVNTTEILSVSFLLITLGLLYKKNPAAGIFLALAGLSKDPNLIFIPMLLLLGEKKKIFVAYSLFVLVTLPWLLFNYWFYGNPFYGYISDFTFNVASTTSLSIPIIPILIGIAIPVIYMLLGLSSSGIKKARQIVISSLKKSSFTAIAMAFSILAVIAYLIIAQNTDPFGKIRFAYLLYLPATLFALIVMQQEIKKMPKLRIYSVSLSAILLIGAFASFYYTETTTQLGSVNVNWNRSIVKSAISKLDSLGYQNCRITSNAWVYLIYLNESAYSSLFLNNSVSTEYPVLIFNGIGISASGYWNINESRLAFSNASFSIYYPKNVTCVK